MNRAEYMKELAFLVQDVPDEEREEALQYYEDYFDDAGPENEEQVIAELGRPEKLAAIIREGARTGYESPDAEYTENGYQNERFRGPQYEIVPPDQVKRKQLGDGRDSGYTSGPYEWEADAGSGNDAGKRRDPDGDTWKDRARSVFEELGQRASEGAREGRRLVEEFNRKRKKEREEAGNQAFRSRAGEETGPGHEETGSDREKTAPDREETGQGKQTAKDAEWFYEKDGSDRQHGSPNAPARRRRNPFLWILAAFGLLFLFPFLIGAIAIMFGLSVAVICLVGGIALAVVIVAAVFVVTGIILLGVGIGKLFLFPLAGMMFMSVGLILLGLGILAVWLTVLICGRLIPGTARMIVNFFSFFGRRRRGGAVS